MWRDLCAQGELEAVERVLSIVPEEHRVPLFADSNERLTCHAVWSDGPTVRDLVLQGLLKYATPLPPSFKLHAPDVLALSKEKTCGHYSLQVELAPGSEVASDTQARQAWVKTLSSALQSGDYKAELRSKLYWLGSSKGGNLRRSGAKGATSEWESLLGPVLDGSTQCDVSSSLQLSTSEAGPVLRVDQLCMGQGSPSCVLAVAAFLATQAPVLHVALLPTTLSSSTPPVKEGPPTRRSLLDKTPSQHRPSLDTATVDAKGLLPRGLSATRRVKTTHVDLSDPNWSHSDPWAEIDKRKTSSDVEKRRLDDAYAQWPGPSFGLDTLEMWSAGLTGRDQVVQVGSVP